MDGRKQWKELGKDEAASPTVMVDSVLITAAIEASENWDVAAIDLPEAYLHADMDDSHNGDERPAGRTNG